MEKIDKKQFENLCGLQCTLLEICDFFDVEDDTLNSWCKKTYGTTFSEVFKIKRGKGQISLRRTQWKLAEKNPTMAIFLGKHYLGQTDKVETSGEERESAGGHATPKPIALCTRAIKSSSRENENILDVFGGSGSTLIACEQNNRNCYVMELEPKWVDVIIERWETFTGNKAVKIEGDNNA